MAAPTTITVNDSAGAHVITLPAGTYVTQIRCGPSAARVGRKVRVIVGEKTFAFPADSGCAKAQDDVSSINIA